MDSRRNPLTPQQERRRKDELVRYGGIVVPDQVYVLYDTKTGKERIFYCGIALRPHIRWGAHQRVARNGVSVLPEYEHMRHVGIENCFMRVVDEDGEFTEAEWMAELRAAGHNLLNVAGGVDVKRKKRTTYKHQDALEGVPLLKKRTAEEDVALWAKIRAAAKRPPELEIT